MKNKLLVGTFFLLVYLFQGCNQNNQATDDGPTYGKITISSDQSLEPLVSEEINVFQNLYQQAKVKTNYKPEAEIFSDLLNDSVKVIVATRQLTSDELKHFNDNKIYPHTVKIAYDALALITNKETSKLKITIDQFRDIISGKLKRWNLIDKKFAPNNIVIITDNRNSSGTRYLQEMIGNDKLPNNIFALDNSSEVIKYVRKSKSAIGIIGVSWISANKDSTTNKFLEDLNIAAISPPDTSSAAGEFYEPYQAYIAQKYYPLTRAIYIISTEARNGLGSGIIAFAAGEKGQRIVLKAGLVPATMPVRLVEIKDDL